MSYIRWKLSGGILILSMGGLVAIADMPEEVPTEPAPVILELPSLDIDPEDKPAIDAPLVFESLPLLTPGSSEEIDLPPLSLSPPVDRIPTEEPIVELAPMPRKVMRVESIETKVDMTPLPHVPTTEFEPIPTPAIDPADVAALPMPQPILTETREPITPAVVEPVAPAVVEPIAPPMSEKVTAQPASTIPDLPIAEDVKPEVQTPRPVIIHPEREFTPEAPPRELKTEVAPNTETLGYTLNSRTLKVLVHMGGDRPWFELRDRDEMYLKVICDNIDVHSPKESDKQVSTIRATGNIRYITPGGQGSCDDLTVSPKDGEVQVKGNVRFRYSWGQVRTTLSAESMTFRLDPITMSDEPSKEMPASYTQPN